MMIGTAAGTPITPAPTRLTIVGVVTDDDWASTVARVPTNRPTRGFSMPRNRASTRSSPRPARPVPRISMAARKAYSSANSSRKRRKRSPEEMSAVVRLPVGGAVCGSPGSVTRRQATCCSPCVHLVEGVRGDQPKPIHPTAASSSSAMTMRSSGARGSSSLR